MFHAYLAFLAISGAGMVLIAAIKAGQRPAARLVNGAVGLAFLSYAFYLQFVFKGGHYLLFYYAFALPVLLLVRFFKSYGASRMAAQQPMPVQQPYGQYQGSEPPRQV